jgi:hypothetical protein
MNKTIFSVFLLVAVISLILHPSNSRSKLGAEMAPFFMYPSSIIPLKNTLAARYCPYLLYFYFTYVEVKERGELKNKENEKHILLYL